MGLSLPQYFREYQLTNKASPIHTHSGRVNKVTSYHHLIALKSVLPICLSYCSLMTQSALSLCLIRL